MVKATDEQGGLVWDGERRPFGERVVAVSDVEMVLGFPGQYFDQETNNYYNYFRDYDPATGRYLQSDPIGLNGGLNTYAYVGLNPLKYIDPKGLAYPIPERNGTVYRGPFGPVCGPEGSELATWIPDGKFTSACRNHDNCYDCSGTSRAVCDNNFCTELLRACPSLGGAACQILARKYCKAVKDNGAEFYKDKNGVECQACVP